MSFDYNSVSVRYKRSVANGLTLYSSPLLEGAGCAAHGFTGRGGGVSAPPYDSLNLGFSRPEPRENVMENYSRLANAAGVGLDKMALASYAHGNACLCVGPESGGAGITAPALPEADGLAAFGSVALVTLHADCLGVLFYDPQSGVYGACHAGWRGVAGGVALSTLKAMQKLGAAAQNVRAWVGPGICGRCYEVDGDVIDAIERAWPDAGALEHQPDGKAQLDLARAMAYQLLEAGIDIKHLELSGLCTFCNKDFFSYRRDNGRTGAMAAFILGNM